MRRSSSKRGLSARTDIQHFLPPMPGWPIAGDVAGRLAAEQGKPARCQGSVAVYDCRVEHEPESSRFSPDEPGALGDAPGRVANIVAAAERAGAVLREQAESRARERIAEADRAAENRVRAAEEEAGEILHAARTQAESARNEALSAVGAPPAQAERVRDEAARALAEAREQANALLSQAREESEHLRATAEEESGGVRATAEEESERLRTAAAAGFEG